MIALQLDKNAENPIPCGSAGQGAYQVYKNIVRAYNSLVHTRLENKLSEEFSTTAKQVWLIKMGRKSVLEYYGEFMEAVNYSYSDGNRNEQLLAGLFIGHMTPSLRDALKKRKM